jgi:hypothetical protein
MRTSVTLAAIALASAAPTSVRACPNAEYERHLRTLSALTSAVNVEMPERSALAAYFQALPPDFSCFNRLFGYSDEPAPLYYEPQLQDLFPKLAAVVPEQDYARKLVGLSVNARWEADQTGALQDAVRAVLDTKPQLFASLLSPLNTDAEESVWSFLFGAPHPSNQPLEKDVQNQVCDASARSCQQSKQVYARAVSNEHTH